MPSPGRVASRTCLRYSAVSLAMALCVYHPKCDATLWNEVQYTDSGITPYKLYRFTGGGNAGCRLDKTTSSLQNARNLHGEGRKGPCNGRGRIYRGNIWWPIFCGLDIRKFVWSIANLSASGIRSSPRQKTSAPISGN